MSFFELRRRLGDMGSREPMAPPPLTPLDVFADLRWQFALYRADRLSLSVTTAFMALRIIQLIQYRRGWLRAIREL